MASDFKEESDDENPRSILHEGYLNKKGQINRAWKKRYFQFLQFMNYKLLHFV